MKEGNPMSEEKKKIATPKVASEERLGEPVEAEQTPPTSEPQGPQVVCATSNESITLPSGASFALTPGQEYTVSPDDANALIESGNAVTAG